MTTGAILLLALSGLVLADYPSQQGLTRQCRPAQTYTAEISYNACYTDASYSWASRTLSGIETELPRNTPQTCADICGRFGYKYAGVKKGSICFCGNQIKDTKAEESSCYVECPGDPQQTCGGEAQAGSSNVSISIWNVANPRDAEKQSVHFPDCTSDPLCSTDVCDTSLSAKERAVALVSLWTAEEKIGNLVEKALGVPRLGIKPYNWWSEGLHGLATSGVDYNSPGSGEWDVATSFPQPILIGAAFDDDLVTEIADVISTETRAYSAAGRVGLDLYTPNINSFKDPRWGRGQETPGEDPFHLQSYTHALLTGLERKVGGYKKVLATCKHFAANDFEVFGNITRHNFNAIIGPQDLNEFYLSPFRTCAELDVGSFMCSYNAVNGAPACANSYLMEKILREHWGWEADEHYISTDCGAVGDIFEDHKYADSLGAAAAVSLKAGADLECSDGNITALTEAWDNGLINGADIDKALVRMWSSLISVGWFDPPDTQELRKLTFEDVNTEKAQKLAYDVAVAGIVLIKNDDQHLPLEKGSGKVAIIGPWANETTQMLGNYRGPAPYIISTLQAANEMGLDYSWAKGTGINAPDDTLDEAIKKAAEADEIIFMGGIDNSMEDEGKDRLNVTWPEPQLDALRKLSSLNKPITVVQFGAGQLDGTELLGSKAIKSIIWAGYPGQSGGRAVLDILYGVAAPAGRLPVTQYPAKYVDEVSVTDMTLRPGQSGTNPGRTHMWYTGKAPAPFGHGLHYTDFQVSIEKKAIWADELTTAAADVAQVKSLIADLPWMHAINQGMIKIVVKAKNIGKVESDYVALLFMRSEVGPKPNPQKTLAGYSRIKAIRPGEEKQAEIILQLGRFLRVEENGDQVLYPGTYELFVDVDEKASLEIEWKGEDPVTVEYFPELWIAP
ncbi:unnamed protein product [Clonostachys rosea]|uniref:xylan 1,4-beta-xylosidase n=1 Tax=Bionectria ochroleuca TaxID=29856 RepID=A0ABY6UIP8_BIOOC|nr:unnamed protein product [Clonostachys rosea]